MTPLAALGDLSHLLAPQPEQPTVIFIPGAFHTAAHFGPLSKYLNTHGCDSFTIRLPSTREKAGTSTTGMAEDVAAIRGVLEELVWDEEGGDGDGDGEDADESANDGKHRPINRDPGKKDVILVMHSSGAIPGCQAVTSLERSHRIKAGKKGSVISLFFICGLLVPEGESLESTMLGLGEAALPGFAELDGPILRPANTTPSFYSDLPPSKAAYWESKLEPQSSSVYTTAVQNTCWELDIPVTYITCTADPGARVTDAMVAKMKKDNWTIETMESGPSSFLSCVEELGDMILKAGQIG